MSRIVEKFLRLLNLFATFSVHIIQCCNFFVTAKEFIRLSEYLNHKIPLKTLNITSLETLSYHYNV